MLKRKLTRFQARRYLAYDPAGFFRWRVGSLGRSRKAGTPVATTENDEGYLSINFVGRSHFLHRVVWAWHYGKVPEGLMMDHVNGDPKDNRIENLRVVTITQNSHNRALQKNNSCGVKGVTKRGNRWIARIYQNRKTLWRGVFRSLEEADAAVREKREELHGEYARHL